MTLNPPAIADRLLPIQPTHCRLFGWVGARVVGNATQRLARIDPNRLLEGYRRRPGRQAWDGEHVGKWLHAASLAWSHTRDAALRAKLDDTVAELLRCQLADGYLGTYLPENRWSEWDVWAHKYNLLGLLTYLEHTGNHEVLSACERMADLLLRSFGEEPGKLDIIGTGHHVGMASTSVLEPMVLLYRVTGETRYLDFCRYLLRAWEQPNGPRLLSTLRQEKSVAKVGNGKAYEMLSCLNGALEYYRATGEQQDIVEACTNAWRDIIEHQLYPTGASSHRERYYGDGELPDTNNVGETCVTVTWLQFNLQLLRLTGDVRYADQIERVVLNQLFGAQHPDCTSWGYYVQMEGRKPYNSNLDGHCCLSSGPRGVALIPSFMVMQDRDGVVLNQYVAGSVSLSLRDCGVPTLTLSVDTEYPLQGAVRIVVEPSQAARFSIRFRVPDWCVEAQARVNGKSVPVQPGFNVVTRAWSSGDRLDLEFPLVVDVRRGTGSRSGKVAFTRGPLVLAADEAFVPELAKLVVHDPTASTVEALKLVPFAEAGAGGSRYKVWLPTPSGRNLLLGGRTSQSRAGVIQGSLVDDDITTYSTTRNGQSAHEDWYAVHLDGPVAIQVVRFAHGASFPEGGWFAGKPRVQIKPERSADWETVGTLDSYPETTATDSQKLLAGWMFTLRLAKPVSAVAVRIVGVPASGTSTTEAFSSAAEIQAFAM